MFMRICTHVYMYVRVLKRFSTRPAKRRRGLSPCRLRCGTRRRNIPPWWPPTRRHPSWASPTCNAAATGKPVSLSQLLKAALALAA